MDCGVPYTPLLLSLPGNEVGNLAMKAGLLRVGNSCPEEKICESRWNDSFTKITNSLKTSVLLVEDGIWGPYKVCRVFYPQAGRHIYSIVTYILDHCWEEIPSHFYCIED